MQELKLERGNGLLERTLVFQVQLLVRSRAWMSNPSELVLTKSCLPVGNGSDILLSSSLNLLKTALV